MTDFGLMNQLNFIASIHDKRQQDVIAWNQANKPVHEFEVDGVTMGVFLLVGDGYAWGQRYRSGYWPEKLVVIPEGVTKFLLQGASGVKSEIVDSGRSERSEGQNRDSSPADPAGKGQIPQQIE